jgi:acetolactate synthase-1/2/3 large subunit
LFLGGSALRAPALRAQRGSPRHRLRADPRDVRGARRARRDLPAVERLHYFPSRAIDGCAARAPRARRRARAGRVLRLSRSPEPARVERDARLALADDAEDITGALEALALRVRAPARAPRTRASSRGLPSGALTARRARSGARGAAARGAIFVDEGRDERPRLLRAVAAARPPHDYLALTGGAIGQGLPSAVGAALACPDRKVIAFQADGSGMYTLQSLWTCARESLDVVVVVAANRAYRILQVELARAGIAEPGAQARALTDLSHPRSTGSRSRAAWAFRARAPTPPRTSSRRSAARSPSRVRG